MAANDITLTTPLTDNQTVSKVQISSITFNVKDKIATIVYESISAPNVFTGNLAIATVSTAGYVLRKPFSADLSSATPQWTDLVTALGATPLAIKNFMVQILPGT